MDSQNSIVGFLARFGAPGVCKVVRSTANAYEAFAVVVHQQILDLELEKLASSNSGLIKELQDQYITIA